MMFHCWVPNTPGRWCNRALSGALALALGLPLAGQTLDKLVTAYRESPSDAGRARIAAYQKANASSEHGALAALALSVLSLEEGQMQEALQWVQVARPALGKLEDYLNYIAGSAAVAGDNPRSAVPAFEQVVRHEPRSPKQLAAIVGLARAHRASGAPQEGLALLERQAGGQNAAGFFLERGLCLEAAGDSAEAAAAYQKVYFEFPASFAAPEAAQGMARLKASMAERYPAPRAEAVLGRVEIWLVARDYGRAESDLRAWIPQLEGPDRELALVRLGEVLRRQGRTWPAYNHLRKLTVSSAPAQAERLYRLAACVRRLGRDSEFLQFVEELRRGHAGSQWALRALVEAGNHFLLANDAQAMEPFYRECAEKYPDEPQAPYCHWRLAWRAYLARSPEAATMLREHLVRYPASLDSAAALYFLGRLAEQQKATAAAAEYYRQLVDLFPNYYYGGLAEERLRTGVLGRVAPAPEAAKFLGSVAFPPVAETRSFQPAASTQLRIERARLLNQAGLYELADEELRFEAENGGQKHLLGMELADLSARRGAHDVGLRYMKRYSFGYLRQPVASSPEKYWRLLYPLPYSAQITSEARRRNLDPYLLAGLIRQESEFNPKARSRSRAYGLTQVLPSTGRQVSRKVGIRRYSTRMLTQPETNLKIGSYYLRHLLDELDGELEPALASYNGGKSRVEQWLTWANYKEPAEFIETIPLSETRGYVQAVLSNARMYRRLYGQGQSAVGSTDGASGSENTRRSGSAPGSAQ